MTTLLNRALGLSSDYHSRFGGLWIDRGDADVLLRKRYFFKSIDKALRDKISHFREHGYVIFEGAVPAAQADTLAHLVKTAYASGDRRLRYHTDGREHLVLQANTDPRGKRIVESHAVLPEVRTLLTTPVLSRFLHKIFDETPVLTQTLIFHNGSEQGFHQDPAYVVFDQPLKMAAAWVALEDIQEGAGELQYIVGSHRLPDYRFSTGRRDSHGAAPGEVGAFGQWLEEETTRRNLPRKRFAARKGDILVWHADLAHGGSPISKPDSTRLSLVGHFCPKSVFPKYPNAKVRRQAGDIYYSSYLYDLGPKGEPGS